jgi:toxin ParE1/3/4
LGDRFLEDINVATRTIERYPNIAPVIDDGVHAKSLLSFPYSLMYVVEEDELFVVAIAHQSRRLGYWADRLPAHPDS